MRMERNPDASGDADFKTLVRKNQGFFMPKIFLNQSTIKDGWERNPDASGDADFKTLVRKNQGFFMPKIFLNQSTIKNGWERNPDASGDADFKTPTFVRIVGLSLCPRFSNFPQPNHLN